MSFRSLNAQTQGISMNKFLASMAVLFFSINACAATPTTESVEKLLAVTYSESMMDSVYLSMEKMMQQNLKQSGLNSPALTAEGQRVRDAFPAKLMAVMREEMNWAKMKPMYIKMYSETYDQEEIDGLIAFYSSPVGQSYQKKMPLVIQSVMSEMQGLMKSFIPKIKIAVDKAAEEAKAAK